MEVCVNHEKQFPGASPHSLPLISQCFSLFHPPLSSAGCVSHSSTLISVCSDNEHGGTTRPAHRERATERRTDGPKRASRCAKREHSVFMGDSLCSTFAVMAYLCAQNLASAYLTSDAWFFFLTMCVSSPDVLMHACG